MAGDQTMKLIRWALNLIMQPNSRRYDDLIRYNLTLGE
jgi:hypothetical protein